MDGSGFQPTLAPAELSLRPSVHSRVTCKAARSCPAPASDTENLAPFFFSARETQHANGSMIGAQCWEFVRMLAADREDEIAKVLRSRRPIIRQGFLGISSGHRNQKSE